MCTNIHLGHVVCRCVSEATALTGQRRWRCLAINVWKRVMGVFQTLKHRVWKSQVLNEADHL